MKVINNKGWVVNMRFLGDEKVLIYGTFVTGYSKNKLPKTPTSVSMKSKELIKTLAIQPGAIETFTSNLVLEKPMLNNWLKENGYPYCKEYSNYIKLYRSRSHQLGYMEIML